MPQVIEGLGVVPHVIVRVAPGLAEEQALWVALARALALGRGVEVSSVQAAGAVKPGGLPVPGRQGTTGAGLPPGQ